MGGNPLSRTPLSYYGGKQAMLAHILPMIPGHEVYTEAFLGGGSVFWSKKKSKNETINDTLDVVVNFYEQVKLNYNALKPLIESSLISRTQHKRAQKLLRDKKADPVLRAWAFWFASNFSFTNKLDGGIKFSNDQNTVVPEQLRNKKRRFTEWLVNRIEDAHIENKDALVILQSRNVEKAFHYIDPPYINADQGHYRGYTVEQFEKLLQWCETCKGKFLLSNYNSDILTEYISKNGWYKKEVSKRLMAPTIKEKDKTEVLVWNYRLSHIHSPKLFDLT